MQKPLRIALVGCGRIAYKHIEAIQQIAEAEIVAVCDLVVAKAEKYAAQLGVNAYSDYHQMLQKEEVGYSLYLNRVWKPCSQRFRDYGVW